MLRKANDKKEKLLLKTDNIQAYLRQLEIECMDNLHFINTPVTGFGEYSGWKTFGDALYQLMLRYQVDLFMSLFEKEPILDDTIGEVNLSIKRLFDNKNNAIILNPIMDEGEVVLPDNLTYFVKDFINNGIIRALNTLGEIYRSVHYIPAVRTKMDRFFRIGNGESYLQEVLYVLHQMDLTETAKQFINGYLQKFGIAESIEIELSEDSSGTKIFFLKGGMRQELADLGYGVAQVLPIILKIGSLISQNHPDEMNNRFYYESSFIIIEEPETNLHLALQSKLADMFVECYQKYNIQFIIETHSEYFIRKLQYLTAKKEFAANDSVIYYFNDPNNIPVGEKQVKKINILEDGSLSDDFGSGFFDEADNLAINLFNLQNRKN